jgi:hypothetical protein
LLKSLSISSQLGIDNLPFDLHGSENADEVVTYLNNLPKSSKDCLDDLSVF